MGRGRRDKVNLTGEQRENLEQISRNGYAPAKGNKEKTSNKSVVMAMHQLKKFSTLGFC